jgi:hypothetical protein
MSTTRWEVIAIAALVALRSRTGLPRRPCPAAKTGDLRISQKRVMDSGRWALSYCERHTRSRFLRRGSWRFGD